MLKDLKLALGRVGERARHRREYTALLEMDDRMLRDIGIDRARVHARLAGHL